MSDEGASGDEIFAAEYKFNGMLFGDLSKGFVSFDLGISLIHEIESVAKIIDRLMEGIKEYL